MIRQLHSFLFPTAVLEWVFKMSLLMFLSKVHVYAWTLGAYNNNNYTLIYIVIEANYNSYSYNYTTRLISTFIISMIITYI